MRTGHRTRRLGMLLCVLGALGCLGVPAPDGRMRALDSPWPDARRYVVADLLSELALPAVPRNLLLKGDVLYVFMNQAGLMSVDVSDPAQPRPITWLRGGARGPDATRHYYYDGIIDGDRMLVADRVRGLTVLDLSDPLRPELGLSLPLPDNRPVDIERIGAHYYLSIGPHGLWRLPRDFDRNTSPVQVWRSYDHTKQATFYPPHWILAVDSHDSGMQVLQLDDAGGVSGAAGYVTDSFVDELVVVNEAVVLNNRTRGILILGMDDPRRPELLSREFSIMQTPYKSLGRLGGSMMALGNIAGFVDLWDLAEPRRPAWLGRFPMGASVNVVTGREDLLVVGLNRVKARPGKELINLRLMRLEHRNR